jgi:DHA2 family methylenomycin A resistance protein-like MFS transporter
VLVSPLAAVGFGTAFTMPAAVAAVVESAPPQRSGIASGVLNAGRQVGSAIGVALFGSLIGGTAHFEKGMRAGSLISGGCFLAAALIAFHSTRRPR